MPLECAGDDVVSVLVVASGDIFSFYPLEWGLLLLFLCLMSIGVLVAWWGV